jgi:hypothetical protein
MLEAAGVLDIASQEATDSGCCVDPDPCADDNCDVVEQGLRTPASASLKVPAAQLLATVGFLCVVQEAAAARELSHEWSVGVEPPLDWVPAWHFERRTAHPPRAPSFVCA